MDFKKLMHTDAGWGITALRIVTGIIFIGHGAPKWGLMGDRTFDSTVEFIGGIGVPVPAAGAFLVATFETVGGACLVLGLLIRFWSAGLAFAMLVATVLVHLPQGMFADGGYQWALLLMAASLALLTEGAGKASLDQALSH